MNERQKQGLKQQIASAVSGLQSQIDRAAEEKQISEEQYDVAFFAACVIDRIVNPDGYGEDEDPVADLMNAITRMEGL